MADIVQQQDSQRTARAFISFLATATGADQSYADADGYAVNYPRQYTVIGGNGLGVEGTSTRAAAGGVVLSPTLLLLAAGAALVYFAMKK